MNIASFFTIQIPGTTPVSSQAGALSGAPLPEGLGFLDLILAQILEKAKAEGEQSLTPTKPNDHKPLQSQNPLLSQKPKLDITQLIAQTPEIEEDIQKLPFDIQTQIEQTLALNQKAFADILKPVEGEALITTPLDNASDPAAILSETEITETPKITLADLLQKLEAFIGKTTSPGTAQDFTPPGKLVSLVQKARQITAAPGNSGNQNPIANLTPEETEELRIVYEEILALFLPSQTQQTTPSNPATQIAAQLNALIVGATTPENLTAKNTSAPSPLSGELPSEESPDIESDGFEKLLKDFGSKKRQHAGSFAKVRKPALR